MDQWLPSHAEVAEKTRRVRRRRLLKIALWTILWIVAIYITLQGYLPTF
ncbi:MAG TPA: hypothetical protein VFE96_03590 [Candidatus Bathyarchaeia archaeon]|nr:hypothetical protein [Candidatus Bathyarchaeia archaeon]